MNGCRGEGQGWKEDAVVWLVWEEELMIVWRETQCGGSVSGAFRMPDAFRPPKESNLD